MRRKPSRPNSSRRNTACAPRDASRRDEAGRIHPSHHSGPIEFDDASSQRCRELAIQHAEVSGSRHRFRREVADKGPTPRHQARARLRCDASLRDAADGTRRGRNAMGGARPRRAIATSTPDRPDFAAGRARPSSRRRPRPSLPAAPECPVAPSRARQCTACDHPSERVAPLPSTAMSNPRGSADRNETTRR